MISVKRTLIMSHFVNIALLPEFVDDYDDVSACGCYIGSTLWDAEVDADIALKREEDRRWEMARMYREIRRLKLRPASKACQETIARLEQEIDMISKGTT